VGFRLGWRVSQVVRRADGLQRRHRLLGFPWAVLSKYFDDDGARLAALITYYGFLSLFPLLLLAAVAVTELVRFNPALQQKLLDQLVRPALQPDVERALDHLPSSGVPLAIGLVGLVFAGTGGVLAVYSALNKVWDVAWRDRFGVVARYVRALFFLVLAFAGAVVSAGCTVLAGNVLRLAALERGAAALERGAAALATVATLFALLGIAHKVLVCRPLRWRDVTAGALIGAIVLTALLNAATTILPVLVTRAGPVYGSFATVVGAFALLYLMSQTFIVSIEVAAVLESRLSPRGLTTAALTGADHRALALLARRQARVPGQHITTTFDEPAPPAEAEPAPPAEAEPAPPAEAEPAPPAEAEPAPPAQAEPAPPAQAEPAPPAQAEPAPPTEAEPPPAEAGPRQPETPARPEDVRPPA
jgi:membrane protein